MTAGEPSQPGDLTQQTFVYLIGRLNRGIQPALAEALSPHELTLPEFTTLSVLARRPGLSNAQLARRALITPQAMIQVLRRLEERGLVTRKVDPGHARILQSSLTPRGRKLLLRAETAVAAIEGQILEQLPAAERESLCEALAAVGERLSFLQRASDPAD